MSLDEKVDGGEQRRPLRKPLLDKHQFGGPIDAIGSGNGRLVNRVDLHGGFVPEMENQADHTLSVPFVDGTRPAWRGSSATA